MREPAKLLATLALAAMAAVGCAREIESDAGSSSGDVIQLSMATTPAAASHDLVYNTYLYSEHDADVYSRLSSGEYFDQGVLLDAIHVEVGDRVAAGQLLATLEEDIFRIAVDAAQAKADEATASFQRVEELRQRELVPPSEHDKALYAKRSADAELERAQLDLARTRVRAPFAGVVAKRYVRAGELIDGDTPLFRITAMAPLRARLLVPEAQSDAFLVGAAARVTGMNGANAVARVAVVGPTIDPGSGTREVIIELAQPGAFRPGTTVSVQPVETREAGSQ